MEGLTEMLDGVERQQYRLAFVQQFGPAILSLKALCWHFYLNLVPTILPAYESLLYITMCP
jgi:hypothetical protein